MRILEVDMKVGLETKDAVIFSSYFLIYVNPLRPNPGQREKIELIFYFHTSLWCLKRFYEGLKGLHKTF